MNFYLSKFFAGETQNGSPTTVDAIQKLRDTEQMLIQKQDFLEKKIEEYVLVAKKNASKNKKVALHALRKKKRWEKNLTQMDGTLTTIEMLCEALEEIQ